MKHTTKSIDDSMIPIARPQVGDPEIENVVHVLRSGMLAGGRFVNDFEGAFADYTGTTYAVATTSGTVALDIALKALGIENGDEVVVPDFTFNATANAVLFQDAKPVFTDVERDTFCIDPNDVLEKISPRTKAIIGVHLFGHPFELSAIQDICEDHQLALIEDCAQAHGAEYTGRTVGSFGTVGCFSFYATKNMTTGEGGMVTTDDPEIGERLRLLINHGQSRKYSHTTLGYNYRMTDIQAAIGVAQLGRLDEFNRKRIGNAEYLNSHLDAPLKTPYKKDNIKHVYHQYVIKIGEEFPMMRDEFIRYLSDNGIGSAVHYPLPVHRQPLYQEMGYERDQCRCATRLSETVISLPVHPLVTDGDLKHICSIINGVS